jgi:hypothetical protein
MRSLFVITERFSVLNPGRLVSKQGGCKEVFPQKWELLAHTFFGKITELPAFSPLLLWRQGCLINTALQWGG